MLLQIYSPEMRLLTVFLILKYNSYIINWTYLYNLMNFTYVYETKHNQNYIHRYSSPPKISLHYLIILRPLLHPRQPMICFLSPEISLYFLKLYMHVYSLFSGFFHSALLFWDSSFCDIYQKLHSFLPLYGSTSLPTHMTSGLFLVSVYFKGRYHDHLRTVFVWKYTFVSLK